MRRHLDKIETRISFCNVAPGSPAVQHKVSNLRVSELISRKKKISKDMGLIRMNSRIVRGPSSAPKNPVASGACNYLAVHLHDVLLVYEFQRSPQEAIESVDFQSLPICHDINQCSADGDNLDIAIGFKSGDVAIWQPIQKRIINRYNKDKIIDASSVTCLKWLPNDANLLVVGHDSGSMYVYDRRLSEDSPIAKEKDLSFSVHSSSKSKANPVQRWALSNKPVHDICFSPSSRLCALPCGDTMCYIVNWEERRVRLSIESYFGSYLCVAWSHDEHYLAAGGEDDCISIYDIVNKTLVARCNGHCSWVSALAFDPWRCESVEHFGGPDQPQESTVERYRLISVGHDTCVLFWDFEPIHLAEEGSEHIPLIGVETTTHIQTHNRVTNLDPLCIQKLHNDPMVGIIVLKDTLITVCSSAIIKTWQISTETSTSTSASI